MFRTVRTKHRSTGRRRRQRTYRSTLRIGASRTNAGHLRQMRRFATSWLRIRTQPLQAASFSRSPMPAHRVATRPVIYAFRAATVRNILDFPISSHATAVISLEHNYLRPNLFSTLQRGHRQQRSFSKTLTRQSCLRAASPGDVEDETAQAVYVATGLGAREPDRFAPPAVLFAPRTIAALEIELAGRKSRSSNMAGSNLSSATSRTCWQSCAGGKPRTLSRFRVLQLLPGRPARQRRRWRSRRARVRPGRACWFAPRMRRSVLAAFRMLRHLRDARPPGLGRWPDTSVVSAAS